VSSAKAVNITFTGNGNVAADINNTVFNGTMLSAATIQAALFNGVTAINNAGGALGNTLSVTNGELATVYGVAGDTSAAGINTTIRASNIAGTEDTIKYSVAGAGSVTGTVAAGQTTNNATLVSATTGIEKISVATSGTNVFSITGSTTALTDNVKLTVTGSGANTITASALTQVATYDLSGSTGTNTLRLDAALATGTTITGGTGADTLRIAPNSTAANVTVTGVETLRLGTGGTTGSTFFTGTPSFATIRMDGDGGETGAQTLNNVGNATAINFIGAGSTALSGTAQAFNTLTVTSSWTGSADTAAINFSNQGMLLTAGIGYTASGAGTVTTLNGIETLTINATDIGTTGATAFTGITDRDLSSLTVTTAGNVTLGTVTAAGVLGTGALTSINLAGATGTNASTLTIGAATINGALVITGAINGNTITNTNAQDTTDQVIFTGNVGVDNLNSLGFTGIVVADGKAGNDILVGGSNADALTGGEGSDNITGGLLADSIVLTEVVAAADTVNMGAGSLQGLAIGAASTAVADTATGFAVANDIVGISITNGQANLLISNGNNGAVAAGAAVVEHVGTAATTLGATTNVVVYDTVLANSAALLTAIGTTAGTKLTTATAFTANSDLVIVWSDGTNAYVGLVNDSQAAGATAALVAADLTYSNLVTLTGVTTANVAAMAAGNFTFIA